MLNYRYEIAPRVEAVGGGWTLKLFEGDTEVGGGVFAADPQEDAHKGIAWFNSMPESERARWLKEANSARPIDAWGAYLSYMAHIDAQCQGEEWLASRRE